MILSMDDILHNCILVIKLYERKHKKKNTTKRQNSCSLTKGRVVTRMGHMEEASEQMAVLFLDVGAVHFIIY